VTTIAFNPSATSSPPFQATVTLDGQAFSLTTMWNFYRGWWYALLTDQSNNRIWFGPLIESPPNDVIPLAPNTFKTSVLSYSESTAQFVITP